KGDDSRLGGSIISLPEISIQTHYGRSVENDTRAFADHMRRDRPRTKENTFQVHRDDRIERIVGHGAGNRAILPLDELRVASDARVIDEHIDRAPASDYFFDGRLNFSITN